MKFQLGSKKIFFERIIQVGLILLGIFIWLKAAQLLPEGTDFISILVSFGLFGCYIRSQTANRKCHIDISPPQFQNFIIPITLMVLGNVFEILVLFSAGWASAIIKIFHLENKLVNKKCILLAQLFLVMGFPWVALDLQPLGWYFRLSGAWTVEFLGTILGLDVTREGSFLVIENAPILVEEACAGLSSMQSMILFSIFFCRQRIQGGYSLILWGSFIISMCWIANTIRICVITGFSLTFDTQFVSANLHDPIGLAILGCLFYTLIKLMQNSTKWFQISQLRGV